MSLALIGVIQWTHTPSQRCAHILEIFLSPADSMDRTQKTRSQLERTLLQVRRSNFSAERHHARSQKFFYGMLGAQLGVIVSTFAMAARNRNLLWSLAAAAGLVAIAFAIYVFLYV